MPNSPSYSLSGKRVWVVGHRGMVGAALLRRLDTEDCEIFAATKGELDLRRQADVQEWMTETRAQAVFLAAATVGGIQANSTRPAEFLYDNLAISTNVIHAAWKTGVEKLLFLGSACIYPRDAPQPMPEEALLNGPLEPTNQWYAIAKIAGMKLCAAYRRQYGCNFIAAQPNNLFGPGDRFDLESSHVTPALMIKAHRAKLAGQASFEVWGSGTPRRELLYVDDLADALVFLMTNYSEEQHVNIGSSQELTISELAEAVAKAVGFEGALVFDSSKPNGMPRKLLDSRRIASMGWSASTPLEEGLEKAYAWFLANRA